MNAGLGLRISLVVMFFATCLSPIVAQTDVVLDSIANVSTAQAAAADSMMTAADSALLLSDSTIVEAVLEAEQGAEGGGLLKILKEKYVEGNPWFMSLVSLVLIVGLAFCIERLVYLTLSSINHRRFMADFRAKLSGGDVEAAREQCRTTRGPIAALCQQALGRLGNGMADVERAVVAHGSIELAKLERGCSWITLCIQIAPSLGFLGTVIGMVMAFDNIQAEGDISATIVAEGMKVALITTIYGIVVAVILQLFYNLIISKIDTLATQMEEAALELLDVIGEGKKTQQDDVDKA